MEDSIDFLRKESVALDTSEADPALKGVNFVLRVSGGNSAPAAGKEAGGAEPVLIKDLHLRNIPLAEALRYICDATRLRYKVDDFAVTLVSPAGPEDLYARTFTVPPDFGSSLVPIQDLLKMRGVQFSEGALATLTSQNQLVVRNRPTELDKIERLIGEADRHVRHNPAPNPPAAEVPIHGEPNQR